MDSADASFSELKAGLGLKVETNARLPDQMSLVFNVGLYDSRASNVLFESGLWLLIDTRQNSRIRLGIGKLRYSDGSKNTGDDCLVPQSICDVSELEVGSEGFLIGC